MPNASPPSDQLPSGLSSPASATPEGQLEGRPARRLSGRSAPVWMLGSGIVVLSLALFATACRAAQPAPSQRQGGQAERGDERPPRTVSVTGQAELKTAPDDLSISVGIVVYDANVRAAKKEGDRRAAALLRIAAAHGVEAKSVQTDEFTITPRTDGAYESRRIVGYELQKHMQICVHDVETLEALLTELFDSGANQLGGVQLGTSKLVELRKQAREQALAAAREKAESAARALGQRLGRPLKIDEGGDGQLFGMYGRQQFANYMGNNDTRAVAGETMAPGKIKVEAAVAVTFELVDP
jgi:uncharacterized protein